MRYSKLNRNAIERLVAVLFTLTWISQIPYFFPHPFQRHEGIANLSKEVVELQDVFKEMAGIQDKTAADIEKQLTAEIRVMWIQSLLFTVLGIIAGVLLIKQKKVGFWLALLLSSYLAVSYIRRIFNHPQMLSVKYFRVKFEYFPVRTVHEVVGLAILLITVIVLLSSLMIKRRHPVD